MNKSHCVVWSEARGAFVVVHEYAATAGKRSSTKTVIAQSIAVAALLAMAAPSVAQVTGPYVVPAGTSFDNTGTIVGTFGSSGIAVNVSAGSVTNSGTITQGPFDGVTGILLNAGTLTAGITNAGLINVQGYGIYLTNSSSASGILNTGTIASYATGFNAGAGGIKVNGGRLGVVTNAGTTSMITSGTLGITISNGASVAGIVNAGSISGLQGGISLHSAGSTISGITNSGAITSTNGDGVTVQDGSVGSIVNSGSIVGGYMGVEVDSTIPGASNSIGSISNSGLIAGGAGGISVYSGGTIGTINNASSAVIGTTGGFGRGIEIMTGGLVTSITNAGTIIGGNDTSNAGIVVLGTVGALTNSGVITGVAAVEVGAGTLTSLINSGQINGGQTGIELNNSALVGSILNTGTITAPGGVILGPTSNGILIGDSSVGNISNSGLIAGGSNGIKVQSATVAGSIQNSGTISGNHTGLVVGASTITGSILNSGTISGGSSHSGIKVGSASVGSISNSGVISGGAGNSYGVAIENSTIGSLINSGTISGGAVGLFVYSGATVTGGITNSGVISGGALGTEIDGANVTGAIVNRSDGVMNGLTLNNANVGSVTNAGTISNGLFLGASTIGSLQNSGTISSPITGYGLLVESSALGNIINSGSVTGLFGGAILSNSTVSGGITNSGKISGQNGIYAGGGSFAGGLTNSGTIAGSAYLGIELAFTTLTGGIHNLAGGVITGESGLVAFFTTLDSITNDAGGKIIGLGPVASGSTETPPFSGLGLIANTTLTGRLTNNGLISGYSNGITIASGSSVMGGIVNTGTISGNVVGIYLGESNTVSGTSVIKGGITNSGDIIGGKYGIQVVGANGAMLSGGVTNSGLILGASAAGVYAANTTLSGSIINSAGGTVSGVDGIDLLSSTVTGGLMNAGTISGSMYSINVDAASAIGQISITGMNTAAFKGDVYAPNSAVSVASGTFTGTNAFNVRSFDISQGAVFDMGTMPSTAGQSNGVIVSQGFTNEGTLSVASHTGVITGNYAQAVSGALGIGVASSTDHGVLAISGAANLSPAASIVVNVASNSSLANKETITGVLTSTALAASTFNVTDNSNVISFIGKVDGNNVDLITSFNAFVLPDVLANKNGNAIGAATVLDRLIVASGSGSTVFNGVIQDLAGLKSTRQVSDAASQTLPVLSGESNLATYAAISQLNSVMQAHAAGNVGLSSGGPYMIDDAAWIRPFGSWADLGNQGSTPGFTSGVTGIALGADGAVNDRMRVGLGFAFANADVSGNASAAPNHDSINLYQLMSYASYALDPRTQIDAELDGGVNSNSSNRSIQFARETATSSFNSSDAHFGLGIGRSLALADYTVFTPSVRLDYTWVSNDSYTEGGAGPLNLNVRSASFESLLTQLGGKLTQKVNDYLTVFGNFGFGYDSMTHDNSNMVAAYAGAPGLSFGTQGVGLKRHVLLGGLGVESIQHGNVPEISLRYDLQQREGFADQSISFKARWLF